MTTMSMRRRGPGTAGFTMVEIAICLAVIGVAMVSIIGVLPAGFQVQRENREDTIINAEGQFFLEAISSGSAGLHYLTNHVERIEVEGRGPGGSFRRVFLNPAAASVAPSDGVLDTGERVVGLLSIPRYDVLFGGVGISNRVTADIRAVTGSLSLQTTNREIRDLTFGYRLTSQIQPIRAFPVSATNFLAGGITDFERVVRSNQFLVARNMEANFHEVVLTLQWPLIWGPLGQTNRVGRNSRTFRTVVSGFLEPTNNLFFMRPGRYARLSLQ